MGIFADTITVVAPIMGLLLVAATFYLDNITGDVEFAHSCEVRVASGLFFVSFLGGGVLLLLSIWQLVKASEMYWILTGWIVLSLITGSFFAGRLAVALIYGVDDIQHQNDSEQEIPLEEESGEASPEATVTDRESSMEES